MSLKIGSSLSYLIGIELVVFLGVFFYTMDTFWFSAGLTITLMLFTLLIILQIFSTSSRNPQILGEPSLKTELMEKFSKDTLDKTKEDLSNLKEDLLMPDENNVSKVLDIKDQFNSIIQEIKSKIDQEHVRDNNIQLTQKVRDVHISDIEKIFKSEIENLNQNLPALEKSVQSKINNLELNILEKIDLNFEKTMNMINNIKNDEEIQVSVQNGSEEKLTPEEDEELTIDSIPIEEKEKIEVSPPHIPEEIESVDLFDVETENLIKYVSNEYSLIRYETIELLQAIEKNHEKTFSNKDFMSFFKNLTSNNFHMIKSIIDLIRNKPIFKPETEKVSVIDGSKEISVNTQNKSPKLPVREKFNLIGRENEILTINKYESQIIHNGSMYKIQKTMGRESLEELKIMEERIEKFFKNREILIVYCNENEKYFIYYK